MNKNEKEKKLKKDKKLIELYDHVKKINQSNNHQSP